MNEFIKQLNENPGLIAIISSISAILGVVIGWMLNLLSDNIRRSRQVKNDLEKERREHFTHKAELMYNQRFEQSETNAKKLEIIFCTYEPSLDRNGFVEITYSKKIADFEKLKKEYYYLENIGESDINELEIAVSNTEATALIPKNYAKLFIDPGSISYRALLDEKIRRNEALELVIYYSEDDSKKGILNSPLKIYYRDSLENECCQTFFTNQCKLHPPKATKYSKWSKQVSIEKNLKNLEVNLKN